ncbi:Intradiol ring-cleavage dioxygenase [Podospora didyma]|uniref:Intradiol ring-cleavage dioxygenase n=1 Tax=Podospora didyma TaxID=330526 RepID=A0AAE0NRT1_9PEZI|nr:Intradiol ring-cleavage dioxygenase [Podospora didyma]
MRSSFIVALAASALVPGAVAHAGGHSEAEIQAELHLRSIVASHSKRAIDKCANSEAAQALKERALARRAATAHAIRQKRDLQNEHVHARRDSAALEKWSAISHEQKGYSLDTPASTLFASNATCALVPETVIGPYYVDGELIRTDITDGQTGVPVHLEVQLVDLDTCAGIPSLLIDVWHCNATGIYSGVSATGQGGLKTTHGRGVQQSDTDGVVEFDTLFPGHYTGRATHIHIMSTANATLLPNATFTGGTAQHIGQIFFDESLKEEVELLAPYNTNTQEVTTNAEDTLAPDEATAEYDPFLNYVMLGDSLEDGLLMWITIALNTSADYSASVSPAAHYYEGGGVADENGGGMGGGGGGGGPDGNGGGAGGPPGGSGVPTGGFPSGTGGGAPPGAGATGAPFSNGTVPAEGGNATVTSGAGGAASSGLLASSTVLSSSTATAAAAPRLAPFAWF